MDSNSIGEEKLSEEHVTSKIHLAIIR